MEHSADITKEGAAFAFVLRAVRRTWRVQIEGKQYLDQYYTNGRRCLIGFWHGKYVPVFPILDGYKACVITSLSTRGSIIGEICRSFGFSNTQIPDEPRLDAFKELLRDLEGIAVNGTAFDGPLGPYHEVKPGLVRLSSMLGFDIIPLAVASKRHFKATKRWDKLEFPLPFTKIALVFGEPIVVEPHIHRSQMNEMTMEVAQKIAALEQRAHAMINGG